MKGLLQQLIEEMAIIVTIAFVLTRLKIFRLTFQQQPTHKAKILMIIVFGFFGFISTYTGIVLNKDSIPPVSILSLKDLSMANTRPAGIVIGGLIGGPLVGLAVGFITGIPRFLIGDFSRFVSLTAYLVSGVLVGWMGQFIRRKGKLTPNHAFLTGAIVEIIHMGFVYTLSEPHEYARELIRLVAVPMIFINALGSWLFALIFENIMEEEEKTRAVQTHKSFMIAERTLPFFRQGLNKHSSEQVAKIIQQFAEADAISITNQTQVLTHVGVGEDHHLASKDVTANMLKQVLDSGQRVIVSSTPEIGCPIENCPLQAAIALPLHIREVTVGTLVLYFSTAERINSVEVELAEGLSKLFSTQLELGEIERQAKLLRDAEIKALHSQVNPHFLFNAINTIVAVCRTDVMLARKLLLDLGTYFRSNLQGARQILIPLSKEIEHVHAFMSLEQARFPDRYLLAIHIEPGLEHMLIPPFLLQPLVENAIKHGMVKRKKGATVEIHIRTQENHIEVNVTDNGMGIAEDKLRLLGKQTVHSDIGTGTALQNISERLKGIYGQDASMTIESELNEGTQIHIIIPITTEGN